MKNKNEPSKVYHYDCQCHSPEHSLRFCFEDWGDGDIELSVDVYLINHQSFFKRLWTALKFLFGGQAKGGHFDNFMMRQEDYDRFIKMVSYAKKIKEEYENGR